MGRTVGQRGEYPFWIATKGNDNVYVLSLRDREMDVLSLMGKPPVMGWLKVNGSPNKMILHAAQSWLCVAIDDAGTIDVFDTLSDTRIDAIKTTAPADAFANAKHYCGRVPNSLTLSPGRKQAICD